MNRRNFLKDTTIGVLGGLGASQHAGAGSCEGTSRDILGPFYQPDAPLRTAIARSAEPGRRLTITGTVSDCAGPVEGAIIDVWQADIKGCYSINEDCGVVPDQPDPFRLRGRMKTDDRGRYTFETIKPAAYKISRDRARPSHIHYKVIMPAAGGKMHTELITQLYFAGDEFISKDPWASSPAAESRIIALHTDSATGFLQGNFDIVVPSRSARTASLDRSSAAGSASPGIVTQRSSDFQGYDLLIHRYADRIAVSLPAEYHGPGTMTLYHANGHLFRQWDGLEGPVIWNTESVPPGTYLARVFLKNPAMEHVVPIEV
jgi:catechol 1,2-dioxygenase